MSVASEISDYDGTLGQVTRLSDEEFAQEWKSRYMYRRAQMLPDVARWLNVLRYFHPRRLEDHWHDVYGNPLPKLYKSEGLSVEIYNFCRPIIEVYGSLLAGQKPLPFTIDVPPMNPDDEIDRYRADAQEKILVEELYRQKIPLHFLDFCVSTVLFGIGYVCSWIDNKSGRLRTQSLPWPGDVLPEWGSDRYAQGSDGMESVIIAERLPLDAARRIYGADMFSGTTDFSDLNMAQSSSAINEMSLGSVLTLKIWWRWDDEGEEKVGYGVVAFDGTKSGESETLYREDDSGYPDIPVRWAARFHTPTEAPHRSAGVLDDIVGINTEYNEKLSAFADMLLKYVYPKYVAKGFTSANVPRLGRDSNMYAVGLQQDIKALQEQLNNVPFDNFLSRLETMMFTVAGLSRLMMGSMPPGDTSGEALSNLLHAAIGRLEGIRTPIQWCWMGLFDEIWVPLMREYYTVGYFDDKTTKYENYSVKPIFNRFGRSLITWPDVTPRDAIKTAEVAMNLFKATALSREGMMQRAGIPSVIDEIDKIRKEHSDSTMNPQDVMMTAQAKQAQIAAQVASAMAPLQVMQAKMQQQQMMAGGPMATPGTGSQPTPQQTMQGQQNKPALDAQRKLEASRSPVLSEENNSPQAGSAENGVQGAQAAMGKR